MLWNVLDGLLLEELVLLLGHLLKIFAASVVDFACLEHPMLRVRHSVCLSFLLVFLLPRLCDLYKLLGSQLLDRLYRRLLYRRWFEHFYTIYIDGFKQVLLFLMAFLVFF